LQEADELPKDFSKLLDEKLFEYHTNLIPSVESLYKQLGVKHAPLTLITPQVIFTTPPVVLGKLP
jgi:intraflagellar transport protein 52